MTPEGRARVMALDDRALLEAMRAGDEWAWSEFHARFRPVLAAAARRARLPADAGTTEADALVDEVLADEAMRLTAPGASVVPNVAAYLVRAARHKLVDVRRASMRRQRWYSAAARHDPLAGEAVLEALCSEHLLTTSAGAHDVAADAARDADIATHAGAVGEPPAPPWESGAPGSAPPRLSPAVLALAAVIRAATTDEERLVLTWVAERVSHRMIATWLGVSYDAATKRIWRLCRKLQAAAVRHVSSLDPVAREEVGRFLRRAGVLPPRRLS